MNNFSEEYIDTICEWMQSFQKDSRNVFVPQFLMQHGIGWDYMHKLLESSERIRNTFDVMVAALCCRWMDLAMLRSHNISKNYANLVTRYLTMYDGHAFSTQQKQGYKHGGIQENGMEKRLQFEKENFADKRITKEYKQFWDANVKANAESTK